MPTIRLKYPIRVGKEVYPNNAVFDATDEVATVALEGKDGIPYAEETDAIERYPIGQPLARVDDWCVPPGAKFPLDPDRELIVPVGVYVNHIDRIVARRINAAEPPPETMSKEPAPAKIDESTIDQGRAKEEARAAEAARVAGAVPVVLVEEEKPKKGTK